jgi:hypothetical protein
MERTTFPDDLLLTQIRVLQAYAALARPHIDHTANLRYELIENLRLLYAHPYWTQPGHSHADLVELRRAARARASARGGDWASAA